MKTFLIDGSLMATIERRKAVTERMAIALLEHPEGLANDREAVRVLLAKGYPTIDVAILAGEARMVAFQEIVAKEMSEP
jgi:hypothetical protein